MEMCFKLLSVGIGLIFLCLYNNISCEVFTSMADVENLLSTEKILVESLDKYIKLEEKRLNKLKKLNQMYANLHNAAKNDSVTFLSNPVNAFLLVKQLSSDWNTTMKLIDNSKSREALTYLLLRKSLFPNREDFEGAAEALMRLQQFYLLDATTLANGDIKGLYKSPEMTAADCYEVGKHAYTIHWSNFSLMWMNEALNRLDEEEIHEIDKLVVLEYMAYSAYEVGNFSYGLSLTQEITKLDPNYTRLYDNLAYYQAKFAERQYLENLKEIGSQNPDPKSNKVIDIEGRPWTEREMLNAYENLCRGETVQANLQTQEVKSKLHCYYETNKNGYFLLGPIKVEVLSFDPRIVVFHEVITEREINLTKAIATPLLARAVVQDTITGQIEVTNDRISKSCTLEDYEHKVIARINRRIQDVTGISIRTAEPIHIINYGIGGHYDPHFDFAQVGDRIEMFRLSGNRMATWIFYVRYFLFKNQLTKFLK
ncbi:prolyl 4-hydroxylase subunit alpha-1 [Parasteatoda tepidariorum]|uniref:prolyl 4-hydroxylase subunit alpha-1 n=1 Tax=Parasteatoda tepidariorum TaxID=114398 RepID=UPI001C724980|nr:prolyl 4-hydroxylase subunit alpha-1 [Parasteatoda tepidariorum]XP_042909594.1 prolyl 4-hydroxylase subunit alpha-1 [Parasteatoda tepidariorum]